jgi:hypothetical protein
MLTSPKLSLNYLCAIKFLRYDNFPVFVKFDVEILQVVLTSTNLSRLGYCLTVLCPCGQVDK